MSQIQHPSAVDLSSELTHGFAARFIRYKAARLVGRAGIRPCDQEDFEQDLRLHLVQRFDKFDPKVAHWNAFVVTVVSHHVLTLLLRRRRSKRGHDLAHISLHDMADGESGLRGESKIPAAEGYANQACDCDETARRDLAIDVRDILARLPARRRKLCQRLMCDSPSEVARQLQMPRTTLRGHILSLRQHFTTEP